MHPKLYEEKNRENEKLKKENGELKTGKEKTTIAASFDKQGGLIVNYAGYGLGFEQYRDVTEQLRRLMQGGELHIRVNEESLQCDPYRGITKHLFVIYSHGNNEGKTIRVSDERLLDLPPDRKI